MSFIDDDIHLVNMYISSIKEKRDMCKLWWNKLCFIKILYCDYEFKRNFKLLIQFLIISLLLIYLLVPH